MRQCHFGRTTGNFALPNVAHYIQPCGAHFDNLIEDIGSHPCSAAGTFNNLVIATDVASGTANTYALRVNGVNTALTCTITDPALTARDTTHSVHVNAGDWISISTTPSGLPATPGILDVAIEFVGDDPNVSIYGVGGAAPTDTRSRGLFNYDPTWGLVWQGGNPAYNTVNVIATAGSVTRYDVKTDTATGGGGSIIFVIYKNGVKQDGGGGTVDTRLTLSGASTTATWTGDLPLLPQDYVWLRTDFVGAPNTGYTSHGVAFTATTDGESIVCGTQSSLCSGTVVLYSVPNAGDQTNFNPWSTTEAPVKTPVGVTSFSLSGLCVLLDAAPNLNPPGSTKAFTFDVRKNGALPVPSPSVTIVDVATTGIDSVLTDLFTLSDGDTWDLVCTPANSPSGPHAAWAFTQKPPTGSITVTKVTTPSNPGLSFGFTATNLTPATFTLEDGDSQVFSDLVAGSGYGIAETSLPLHWGPGPITVSNGSDPTNITVAPAEAVTVTVRNALAFHVRERVIRRLRRAPHITQNNKRIFVNQFELILQPGVGTVVDPGVDPQVMLRVSYDAGKTWEPEQQMSAGELGHYRKRVIARQLGQGRDLVFEVTVSDPVAWYLTEAFLEIEQGLT